MRATQLILFAGLLLCAVTAKVYFQDSFDDKSFSKWVVSTHKGAEAGAWKVEKGKYFDNDKDAWGLKTTEDARFYQISAKLSETFDNKGKDLVLQFSVKHEQDIDCGGAYVKLLPKGLDQKSFNGDSPYHIMFGPDVCGPSNRKVHAILTYKGTNHLIKEEVPLITDVNTHVYTFVLHPDQTFEILIDGESKRSGKITEEWDLLPPAKIRDPSKEKPSDWVDDAEIDDPSDKKPEGWDDIPETIADPDAEKPDDWDEELDGEWEAPQIPNPAYKGPWRPKMIPNPDYKGPWVHPEIENPDYFEDKEIYAFDDHSAVGFELWQVLSGTILDNVLVTDDEQTAENERKRIAALQKTEKEVYDALQEEEKKTEEARKSADSEGDEDINFADLDLEDDFDLNSDGHGDEL